MRTILGLVAVVLLGACGGEKKAPAAESSGTAALGDPAAPMGGAEGAKDRGVKVEWDTKEREAMPFKPTAKRYSNAELCELVPLEKMKEIFDRPELHLIERRGADDCSWGTGQYNSIINIG